MPLSRRILAATLIAAFAAASVQRSDGQHPQTDAPQGRPDKAKIVPVVMLKPGESRELLLSTWCTVGVTRGGGLSVREMADDHAPGPKDATSKDGKTWRRSGVTVAVPDFQAASTTAASPEFAALKAQGIDAFYVKIAADTDAKRGLYELHVADSTCSGFCSADIRVLVVGR